MTLLFDGMDGNAVFKDKHVFDKTYIPRNILHRKEEIDSLVFNVGQIMQGIRPNDMILYGQRGTGKTLIVRYVMGELEKTTKDVKIYYINLREKPTNFRAWKEIAKIVMNRELSNRDAPDVANHVFDYLGGLKEKYIILILDEVNGVIDGYDSFFYYLLRPHEVYPKISNKEISCIFITNNVKYPQNLSEGTLSSFKLVDQAAYAPYLAPQLRDILYDRAIDGLKDGSYDEEVIGLCAAYGAQEHGDARQTIKILVKAAELAGRDGSGVISTQHVKKSLGLVEFDRTTKVLSTLPLHQKILALACVRDYKRILKGDSINFKSKKITVYSEYKEICATMGVEPLGYRRISDFFGELATLGIIGLDTVHSKGQSTYITLLVPVDIDVVLTDDSRLEIYRHNTSQNPKQTKIT